MIKNTFYLFLKVESKTCALNFRYVVEHLRWNEPIVFTVGDNIFLAISIIILSTPDYALYIIFFGT